MSTIITCDVAIIGSGAGGGTVAAALAPLVAEGLRVVVFEQGAKLRDDEFDGGELTMAPVLYEDGGGFLTADGTMTLAFGRTYGGSTVVYTGTSLVAPERVIRGWGVPGLTASDLARRSEKYVRQNNVHLLPPDEINDNNRLFVEGCSAVGHTAEQFPINVRGCLGSSLCNLGCPNGAKQGTHRVQLPEAERRGVEVITRAEVVRVDQRALRVRVTEKQSGAKGEPSAWAPGEYDVHARIIVAAGGSIGTSALLLRSGLGARLPRLGHGFTCHPAFILVAEHANTITNFIGHPKSYFLDRADIEGYVLETCMYFPFTTAKNLTGFGAEHAAMMQAFERLQMILVLACDRGVEENRIAVDRNGRPVVHYRFTPAVVDSLTAATRTAARIFFGAGALRVHAPLADPHLITRDEIERIDERITPAHFVPGTTSVSAAHMMGGCGMGGSAVNSVCDAWGRAHGMPWLRVADSSLFPDSLEINPYLTVMALADRTAEAVKRDLPELGAPPS